MDIQNLLIVAAVIHVVVRLLKAGKLNGCIPPRCRPILAVLLGGAAAAIDTYVRGVPWQQALAQGMLGAAAAMGLHDVGVEALLGGAELFGKKERLR